MTDTTHPNDREAWIGPIPPAPAFAGHESLFGRDSEDMAEDRPAWGNYVPYRDGNGGYISDGRTPLDRRPDGWYVARPDRRSWRAVQIARDAICAGAPIPAGVRDDEAEEARRQLALGRPLYVLMLGEAEQAWYFEGEEGESSSPAPW